MIEYWGVLRAVYLSVTSATAPALLYSPASMQAFTRKNSTVSAEDAARQLREVEID